MAKRIRLYLSFISQDNLKVFNAKKGVRIFMSNHDHYDDMMLRNVFSRTKVIAMVGASGD